MVKLEEVEDQAFTYERPTAAKGDTLLADDDEDYTDTDSEISDSSDLAVVPDETFYDRITALRDIIPPKARSQISSVASSLISTTSKGVTYSGKGLWVLATSVLLLGIPYALALQDEQMAMEEERQRSLMAEGAQGLMQGGESEAKPAL